ncbi:MAG: hypothetical protein EBQ85_03645 [Proteobacteria bacterium]|nr:hypothetical protein [Pseudomonadota bacterium]
MLKTVRNVFFLLLCLSFTVSCQSRSKNQHIPDGYQSPKEPVAPPGTAQVPGSGPLGLKAEFHPLEEPHHYEVQLNWFVEKREPSIFFIIKRSDWNDGRVVQGDQGFFQDREVTEGQTYSYQVQMLNASAGPSTDFAQIQIPKDRVFESGETVIKGEIKEFYRIVLKKGAKLFWQGEKLEIDTGEIVSEDAVMESFSPNLKIASPGVPGRDGGKLILKANKIHGNLYIRADGQKGGQGLSGENGQSGAKGRRGAETFLYWGNPLNFPYTAINYRGHWFYCDPPRPPGSQGEAGSDGSPGGTGLAGGNSARIFIEIKNAETGTVFLTRQPGEGGLGGEGGPGGSGGEGGEPGVIDWQTHTPNLPSPGEAPFEEFQQCRGIKGPTGLTGKQGTSGQRGSSGFEAPFCFKLGEAQQGLCH